LPEHRHPLCSSSAKDGHKLRPTPLYISDNCEGLPCNRELETEVVQRQQVEIDLIDSREQIRTIIDTVVDPIITINDRGVIESANSSLVKVFGYRPEEVLGQNVKIMMSAPYRNEYDGYLNRYLNTNEKQIIDVGREVMGQRKDGTVFPMDLAVNEVHFKGRTLFIGIVRDITARKHMEEEVRKAQNLELLGILAGDMPTTLTIC
jgi:PAS domain S-box-containing protein